MKTFPWGQKIETHQFKGLEVIEHYPHKFKGGSQVHGEYEIKPSFHVPALHESFPSYDIAVIGIICHKYQGRNNRLTYAISRMLGMEGCKP